MSELAAATAAGGHESSQDVAATRAKSREQVDYIEYFRGLAIILIIAGHAFDMTWAQSLSDRLVVPVNWFGLPSVLITGGTFYFVFISGFLYRYVFYGRTSYGAFMYKKALNVGLPYLLLGSALAIFQIVASDLHVVMFKRGAVLGENVYLDFVSQLLTGQMMTAYWYIPFIMVIFLASPLFDWLIRQSDRTKVAVLLIWVLLAFWVHRPYENLNPIHSILYFGHMYLFGIMFCEHRKRLMPVLTSLAPILVLAVVWMAIALFEDLAQHAYDSIERSPGDGWWPKGFDLILLQKYVGVVLLCGVLGRWGHRAQGFLRLMASNSFGLYFIHGIVLAAMSHLPSLVAPELQMPTATFAVNVIISIFVSLAVVLVVKQIVGERSRYLIGS